MTQETKEDLLRRALELDLEFDRLNEMPVSIMKIAALATADLVYEEFSESSALRWVLDRAFLTLGEDQNGNECFEWIEWRRSILAEAIYKAMAPIANIYEE